MTDPQTSRWRAAAAFFAAFVAFDAALVLWFTRRDPAPAAPSVATAAPSAPAPAASLAPVALPRAVGAPAASPGAPRRRLLASDPDPTPAATYTAAPAANYGDAFESWDGRPSEVKTLIAVGTIRLGVARKAEMRDERQATRVLSELGKELLEREKGRTDSWEERAHDYQPLLERYAGRLQPYMTGDFAFHGEGWVLFHGVHAAPEAAPSR